MKSNHLIMFYENNFFCLTLTSAEERFRPCLSILQNLQQFSDELHN